MKKYILLTGSIVNIGGGQIYCKNMKEYLEENDWEVEIYSFVEGEIIIPNLEKFKNNIIVELKQFPNLHTNKMQQKILKKFCKGDAFDEVIIESHTINLAIWGELIAKKIGGKHFSYLLTETFSCLTREKIDFLSFKHRRRELAGISPNSLSLLFDGYKELRDSEKYFFPASLGNPVEDVPNSTIDNIVKKDFNIASITRLEKPFVLPLINSIIKFALNNKDKKVQFVLVGSSSYSNIIDEIAEKAKCIENLNILVTGFLQPIPRNLFEKIDLFIGIAGGAKIPAYEGSLSLVVDHKSAKPIGILEYETTKTLYGEIDESLLLEDKLEEILIRKELHKKDLEISSSKPSDFRSEYGNKIKFIYSQTREDCYYNINKIRPTFIEMLKRLVYFIPFPTLHKKIPMIKRISKKVKERDKL